MTTSNLSLNVTVQNREKVLYQGTATAISSYNEKGIFDVLPKHTNFITLVKDKVIIHQVDGKHQTISCRQGVIWVRQNVVRVIIDFAMDK